MSEAISWFFLLHAFSAGCTALTGIEATSNGVQAFKPPESKNAARVLIWMACLLGIIFTGITLLAYWGGVVPVNEETVVSQIARSLFGRTPLYFLIQGAVALILLLASNTPFADFPRVASQLAEDGYLPRQFRNLGSRLVFANGIIALACAAIFLIYVFNGSVHALIPLYAVGVFLGFSLSQFGMVSHWRRIGDSKNRKKILLNAVGGVTTTIVLCVVFVSKFREGAWILLPSLALLFFLMKQIKSHYASVGNILALNGVPLQEIPPDKTMVILVPGFDRVTIRCVHFAQSFRPAHLRAFHVAFSVEEAEALDKKWKSYFPDVPLDIFVSEYRDLFGPVFDYLKKIEIEWSNDTVIAVMPELVPSKIWHHFLHNKTTLRLQLALEQDPEINVEILEVPFKIKV